MPMLDSGRWMPDDQEMPPEWIIRVGEKDYGPANLEMLREWKREGRVIAQNPARPADVDAAAVAGSAEEALWTTAAKIPGLFDGEALVEASVLRSPRRPSRQHRSLGQILAETFRIYGKGFFQFFYLTLLVALPSICAQLSSSAVDTSSSVNPDLRSAVAAAFTLCMFLLSLAAWPIFIAGIQILTAELAAGRPARIFGLFHRIIGFWPRVAILCIFVYAVFFLLSVFAIGIAAMLVVGATSLVTIVLALGLLCLQVWLFGRFYINVLFWQQFAVLEDSDAGTALRQSKELARSGADLPWYQRPMWRGVFIASLWCAFLIALYIGPEWSFIRQYFHLAMTSADPQAILQTLRESAKAQGFDITSFSLGLLQTLLRPLVGIAFVLLYFDSRANLTDENL